MSRSSAQGSGFALISRIAAMLALAVALASCSDDASGHGLTGVWQQTGVIVAPHTSAPIYEFHKDGTYALDGSGGQSRRGRYKIDGNKLTLTDVLGGSGITYEIDDKSLTLTRQITMPGAPANFPKLTDVSHWKRIDAAPYLLTERVGNDSVPMGLDVQLTQELAAARVWQSDAYPVSLEISEYGPGFYKVQMSFQSHKSERSLNVVLTPHFSDSRILPITGGGSKAIPANFVDLPQALKRAQDLGFQGPLRDADLRFYPQYGAVWMILGHRGGKGVTLAAETGNPITKDVTGTIANYNAQWDKAIAGLKKVIQGDSPCADPLSFECDRERAHQRFVSHQAYCGRHRYDSGQDTNCSDLL